MFENSMSAHAHECTALTEFAMNPRHPESRSPYKFKRKNCMRAATRMSGKKIQYRKK